MGRGEYDNDNLGNSFITTTTPEVREAIRAVAAKRIFFLIVGICLVVAGFIAWELADLLALLQ